MEKVAGELLESKALLTVIKSHSLMLWASNLAISMYMSQLANWPIR